MAYTANKLKSVAYRKSVIDNPADATVARYVGPGGAGVFADMRNYAALLVSCLFYSGTGVLTFKVFGATDAAGTGATVIAAHSDPTVADAAGDQVFLEISAEQLRALGASYRYVAVEIDNDHADDINILGFEFAAPRDAYDALTADVIA